MGISDQLSISTLSLWLRSFLQRRGLRSPDHRTLYEYQVSSEEYIDLKKALSELGTSNRFFKDIDANACFTLFCAEWYRREYESSFGWSWERVWCSLKFSLAPSELANVVPRGLESYWNRPLRYYESERRNFLGSVFSEGGLPFRVLEQEGSRFQSLFSRILKEYDCTESSVCTTQQLTEALIKRSKLPQVFSEDTSVDLIATMADQLVSLVRLYALDTKEEPVNYLDDKNPRWRDSFPIPLDDTTGSELLNGLLRSATDKGKRAQHRTDDSVRCSHFWSELKPDCLQVEISLPAEIIFQLSSEPASCRFELGICEGGDQIASLGAGYAVLEHRSAKVRPRQRLIRCKRREPGRELFLVAMYGGLVLARRPIDNGSVGINEVPVGFELRDGRWLWCGQASFNSKADEVLLLLPDRSRIEVESGEVYENELVVGCKAARVAGAVTVIVGADETYRIKTGVFSSANIMPTLKGKTVEWQSYPAIAFYGVPEIDWSEESDPSLIAQGANVYLSGKPLSEFSVQQQLGNHYLSVRNNQGETLLRKRVGILPVDMKIKLKKGEQPNQGSILFYTSFSYQYHILDKSVSCRRVYYDDCTELLLKKKDIPPAHVTVALTPNLAKDPVHIKLPFPVSGALAFDKNQNFLSRTLSVSDLLGSRVYLFAQEGCPIKYELELRLLGNNTAQAHDSWSYTAIDRPLEVSLFNIKKEVENLLSLQDGIDQTVELRICGGGQEYLYRILRYSKKMSIDYSRHILFTSNRLERSGEYPKPTLMLLSEPERKPAELRPRLSEGVPTGEFELPYFLDKNGPWLIVPEKNSAISFRPIFFPGGMVRPDDLAEIKSLQKATLAFDKNAGMNAFTSILDAMAYEPSHSGWQFLKTLYDHYGYLPLATFEVWRALIRHPDALAMAILKFDMNPTFLMRLEKEFPIFWEFFSLHSLKIAGERMGEFLSAKGIPTECLPDLLESMYEQLANVFPVYGGDVQSWLSRSQLPPPMAFSSMINGIKIWYQDLIRVRSDERWPEYGGNPLKDWFKQQTNCPISIVPEMNYRNAVVYLPAFAASVAIGRT